jgi:hypothetical protein
VTRHQAGRLSRAPEHIVTLAGLPLRGAGDTREYQVRTAEQMLADQDAAEAAEAAEAGEAQEAAEVAEAAEAAEARH